MRSRTRSTSWMFVFGCLGCLVGEVHEAYGERRKEKRVGVQGSKGVPKRVVAAVKRAPKIKGMTLSCFGWGAAWATGLMKRSMKELRGLGSNWISFHPYAQIYNDGSLRFSRSLKQPTVRNPMRFAKHLQMKILLKPHISYWGTRFGWRGDITFKDEASWRRFFRDYKAWTVVQAKMAQLGGAAMFSVGLEYKKTLHREKDWRAVIAAVRKVYKGKLIYSANWDTYHKVKFWDALDFIGIQAYFPLSKKPNPRAQDLLRGWEPIIKKLRAFSQRHKKPIIFTELGYNRASHTAARPWDHAEGGPHAAAIKLRCMRVALKRLSREGFLRGVFLWKWFPWMWNISSNYTLQYPAMKRVLRRQWRRK